jgi:hypothetical protein
MFEKKQNYALWKINKSNRKTSARIRALEYILKKIPYAVKYLEIMRHKSLISIDFTKLH